MKQMLHIYSDYLLALFSQITATGLSTLMDGDISHDQVTRFLSSQKKTSKDLWQIVKPFQRKINSSDGVLIIDDSIEEKPFTDENDIICWHYDHSKHRTIKGINFVRKPDVYQTRLRKRGHLSDQRQSQGRTLFGR